MESTSKYSYTKAVRFSLEKEFGNLEIPKPKNTKEGELVKETKKLIQEVKSLLYSYDKKKEALKKQIKNLLVVKKDFLKQYFKNEFYQSNQKKEYFVCKVDFLKQKLDDSIFETKEESFDLILEKIEMFLQRAEDNQQRKTEIGSFVNRLCSKKYLFLMRDLFKSLNHKNLSQEINSLSKKINKIVESWLAIQENYLPSQSGGLCIAKGGMNYNTVNKKSKAYFDGEIKKLESQRGAENFSYDKETKTLSGFKEWDFKARQNIDKEFQFDSYSPEAIFLDNYEKIENSDGNIVTFNIEEIKFLMQDLKAKMKSQFFQECQQKISKKNNLDEISDFYFFKGESYVEECTKITEKIEQFTNKKLTDAQKDERTKLKKQRGDFLIKRSFFDEKKHKKVFNEHFKEWVQFVEVYKKIAMEYGKIKSRLKNFERQQLEAKQNKYWVSIEERGDDKYLWLIPKEKMQDFKQRLKNDPKGKIKINVIHSFTKRALHKLCFAEESSFIEGLKPNYHRYKSLINLHKDCKKATNKNVKNSEKSKSEYELEFMQGILQTDYAKKVLDLQNYDLTKVLQAKTPDDFEKAMNSLYQMQPFYLTQNDKNNLVKKFKIVICKITSYDIEQRNKNEYQTPKSNEKRHTQMWFDFWQDKNGDKIRLNPEVKINFRRKDGEQEQYLKNKNLENKNSKTGVTNRKIKDQLFATFTLTLNPNSLHTDLAFADIREIQEKINDFNQEFNKQNWDKFYKYGIDRGNIELATLCIAKFNQNNYYTYDKNKGEKQKILKPTFPIGEQEIKCYELKKDFYNTKQEPSSDKVKFKEIHKKRIFNNLSYFTDRKDLFKEKSCSFIDLTKAKVINDKIFLNGDVFTFLKLKKEAAKRIIYEKFSENLTISDWIDGEGTYLAINGRAVYFYEKDYEGLELKDYTYTKDEIKQRFEKYLEDLKNDRGNAEKHTATINQINHLRDAIVANMIGVIAFLQKPYPGFVILEDLDKETIHEHFQGLQLNISRRLEYALFQKFQTEGFVPPHIKNLIEIRESKVKEKLRQIEESKNSNTQKKKQISEIDRKHTDQYGAIIFTSEKQTSGACPYCENEWQYNKDKKDTLKFTNHQYICGEHNKKCGFDTQNITDEHKEKITNEINDPDKVAAYNVAKKCEKLKSKIFKDNKPNNTNNSSQTSTNFTVQDLQNKFNKR